jgi:L-asparaginase II
MLATCVAAGWPTESYLDPGHPLQQRIAETVTRLSGDEIAATGVDGCGAPLFAISLTGLARAFRAVVLAEPGSAQRRVADAMRSYPDWTSGTRRQERALMEAVPGLLVKAGAEGVQAFALADGRAAAFKIEDGAGRAVPAISVALLRTLGVDASSAGDGLTASTAALAEIERVPIYGGGREVGHMRALLPGG